MSKKYCDARIQVNQAILFLSCARYTTLTNRYTSIINGDHVKIKHNVDPKLTYDVLQSK